MCQFGLSPATRSYIFCINSLPCGTALVMNLRLPASACIFLTVVFLDWMTSSSCFSILSCLSLRMAIAMHTESNTNPEKVKDWVSYTNFSGASGKPISAEVSLTTVAVLRHTRKFL